MNLTKFIRRDIVDYQEYKPVPSAYDISVQTTTAIEDICKLDAGENIFGPSPRLLTALSSFKGYQFYPDPEYKRLRSKLSQYTGASIDTIAIGSGGDEIIDLLLRLIIEPGDEIIDTPPTFSSYAISTALNRGQVITVPRKTDFSLDLQNIKNAITSKTKMIIVCNPNNPTGTSSNQSEIVELLQTGVLVFVDEAYYEFSGKTVVPLIQQYPNLVVLRTFSKWAGIAGLRLGYVIANQYMVKQIMKIKPPYNANTAAEVAGVAALEDMNYAKKIITLIKSERERMYKALQSNKKCIVYPSEGNFLFVQITDDFDTFKREFTRQHIAVRFYDSQLTDKAIRVTIGKPDQNDRVIKTLQSL